VASPAKWLSLASMWFELVKCLGENHTPELALIGAVLVKLTNMRFELPFAARLTLFKGYGVGAKC
jgi:hypothetical protein